MGNQCEKDERVINLPRSITGKHDDDNVKILVDDYRHHKPVDKQGTMAELILLKYWPFSGKKLFD